MTLATLLDPARGPTGLPEAAGAGVERVDRLLHETVVATAIVFVAILAWLVVTLVRHRRGHIADTRPTSPRQVLVAVAIGAVVLAFVDANLFLHSTFDLRRSLAAAAAATTDPRTVRVEINARQWAWETRTAGRDGAFATADDVVTTNELRVPVGAPVLLQIAAVDVVHAFNLPNFRLKIDAIPGRLNHGAFTAVRTGTYEITCAQHCGAFHYRMKGALIVLPPDEYARWADHASALAAQGADPANPGGWGWPWR